MYEVHDTVGGSPRVRVEKVLLPISRLFLDFSGVGPHCAALFPSDVKFPAVGLTCRLLFYNFSFLSQLLLFSPTVGGLPQPTYWHSEA